MAALLKLVFFCFALYSADTNAMEEEKVQGVGKGFPSALDYAKEMKTQEKESVLIVGCGHSNAPGVEGNHTHESCWSVDVTNPEVYRDISKGTPPQNPQWKEIFADEELDVTNPRQGRKYKNLFDVIVLERPWSTTLNNAYTLYNTSLMLKPGGMLIIDVHNSYNYRLYDGENSINNLVFPPSPPFIKIGLISSINDHFATIKQMKEDFPDNFDAEKTKEILQKFNIIIKNDNQKINLAPQLFNIGIYLTNWGFENVMNLKSVPQPYTSGHGLPARSGDLLIAIKSEHTDLLMQDWKAAIDSFVTAHKHKK